MKHWITPDGNYYEGDLVAPGSIECAQRPDGYVLTDTWQTDPMNVTACWRAKTTAELDAEKTVLADFEAQFSEPEKALAKVMLDEVNILRATAGLSARTLAQLKAAIKAKLP